MVPDLQRGFRLGVWKVESLMGSISGPNDQVRHVEPKVMEVLVLLSRHANEVVTRDRLIDAVWQRHVSADQLLNRAISELRRALQDQRQNPTYIETIPKRGYRLLGEIAPIDEPGRGLGSRTPKARAPRAGYRIVLPVLAVTFGLAYLVYSVRLPPGDAVTPEDWATPGTSIAVLPFVNMSDDPGNEYLADGLSEEIRNLLAQLPDLKVIGRTSSSAFTGRDQDLRVIGRQLGVETLLEGSVRTSGGRIRIAAQLIDVEDASQIWSQTYHRSMTDLFEIQDDVAAAVIDALQLHIGRYPSRGRPTESAEAYGLFLKARIALNVQDAETAEADLRKAVETDPGFAEALELLAHLYWTADEPARMREAAARALAIDAGLPLARSLYIEGDPDNYSLADAIDAQLRAALANPNDPATLRTLSWNLMITGYLGEALQVAERLAEIDPLSQIAHIRRAAVRRAAGREHDSQAALEIAHRLPGVVQLDWYFGEMYLSRQQDEMAISHFEAAVRGVGEPDTAWVREIVTGSRDPRTGQAFLDRQIPLVRQSAVADDAELWSFLNHFYLLFGHLDRYLAIILDEEQDHSMWSQALYYVWHGTVYRDLGFTAHPRYLELAEVMGFVDVWEDRGPPDFCDKTNGDWVCR